MKVDEKLNSEVHRQCNQVITSLKNKIVSLTRQRSELLINAKVQANTIKSLSNSLAKLDRTVKPVPKDEEHKPETFKLKTKHKIVYLILGIVTNQLIHYFFM